MQKPYIHVNFGDGLVILLATPTTVTLTGMHWAGEEGETPRKCMVQIDRTQVLAALKEWLDLKADYTASDEKRMREQKQDRRYAGQGVVYFEGIEQIGVEKFRRSSTRSVRRWRSGKRRTTRSIWSMADAARGVLHHGADSRFFG